MDALDAFQKAQIAKAKTEISVKMAINEENRKNHFREIHNRLKKRNERISVPVKSKRVKPLCPPPWPKQSH